MVGNGRIFVGSTYGWPGYVKTLKLSWWVNSQSCGSKSSVGHQRFGEFKTTCLNSRHLYTFMDQVWAATSMSEVLLEMQNAQWPHSYLYYPYRFEFSTISCCHIISPFFCRIPTLMPNFEIRKIDQRNPTVRFRFGGAGTSQRLAELGFCALSASQSAHKAKLTYLGL